MKNTILAFCCILLQQPLFAENKDWLIDGSSYKTEVNLSSDKKQIELTNGLLRRSFSLTPNGATIALDNLMTGQNELRAVRPGSRACHQWKRVSSRRFGRAACP